MNSSHKGNPEVLIWGDVMLDHYIKGSSDRLSPEAPVPVVTVNDEYYSPGGATNVAYNMAGLEVWNSIIGIKGDDENGVLLSNSIKSPYIADNLIELKGYPTTTKTRITIGWHQIVRVDREQRPTKEHYSKIYDFVEKSINWINTFKYIILSDYDKGFCDESILNLLRSSIKHDSPKLLIDPKGITWDKYKNTFLVKPNLKELESVVGQMIPNEDSAVEHFGSIVLERFEIKNLLITRSEKGMTLINNQGSTHLQSEVKSVFDVSGAGDTVIAVITYGLLAGMNLMEAVKLANRAAGIVVAKPGVVAITKNELDNLRVLSHK